MEEAVEQTVKLLKGRAKEVKTKNEKLNIATISANNDKDLGKLIT